MITFCDSHCQNIYNLVSPYTFLDAWRVWVQPVEIRCGLPHWGETQGLWRLCPQLCQPVQPAGRRGESFKDCFFIKKLEYQQFLWNFESWTNQGEDQGLWGQSQPRRGWEVTIISYQCYICTALVEFPPTHLMQVWCEHGEGWLAWDHPVQEAGRGEGGGGGQVGGIRFFSSFSLPMGLLVVTRWYSGSPTHLQNGLGNLWLV